MTDYAESMYNTGLPFRDYGGDHVNNDVYTRATTYDEKSHILEEVVETSGRLATTTYDYKAESSTNVYNGAYMGGIVTHQATHTEIDVDLDGIYAESGVDDHTNAEMRTYYEWWDTAQRSHQDYDEQAHTGGVYPWHSDYDYDALGNLKQVAIDDGHTDDDDIRNIDFVNDAQGRVLKRYEDGGNVTGVSSDNLLELHYYFNGMRVGDVGNNGTSNIDYTQSITEHMASGGTGAFRGGATSSIQLVDFDQSYDRINGLTYENAASRYTVAEGNTLCNSSRVSDTCI